MPFIMGRFSSPVQHPTFVGVEMVAPGSVWPIRRLAPFLFLCMTQQYHVERAPRETIIGHASALQVGRHHPETHDKIILAPQSLLIAARERKIGKKIETCPDFIRTTHPFSQQLI